MFSESLTVRVPSRLSIILAQTNDERLLYSLLQADKIALAALKFERDHGLNANERKEVIARLCQLSLTSVSSEKKINTVLATIKTEKSESEPGQSTITSRQQVLSYWYEQAAAPEAIKWLIDAWNDYFNKHAANDNDFNIEGIAFAPVASDEDQVKVISAKALCEGILSDDRALVVKCLGILSDGVLNKSDSAINLFTSALSTLNASSHDRKQDVMPSHSKIESSSQTEGNANPRDRKQEKIPSHKEMKFLSQTRNNEDLLQQAAITGCQDSQLKLFGLILQEKTKPLRSFLQKKEALNGLLANAFGEDSSELAKTLLNNYFMDDATRSELLRLFLIDGMAGLDFDALANDPGRLLSVFANANFIDFIRDQPLIGRQNPAEIRQRFAQLFPLKDLCDAATSFLTGFRTSDNRIKYCKANSQVHIFVLLLLHGVEDPCFKRNFSLALELLNIMSKIDKTDLYADYLKAYLHEHFSDNLSLEINAFTLYDKIAYDYKARGSEIASVIIKASQARLWSLDTLEGVPDELRETSRVLKENRLMPKLEEAERFYRSGRSLVVNDEVLAQLREHFADAILLSAMNEERCGTNKRAFDYYVQYIETLIDRKVTEFEKDDYDTRYRFAAVALAILGQNNGFTISSKIGAGIEEKTSYLVPLCKKSPYSRKCSYLGESRYIHFTEQEDKFERWYYKKTKAEKEIKELLLNIKGNFDKIVLLSAQIENNIAETTSLYQRQFWQKYLDKTWACMFSEATAFDASKSVKNAWHKLCENKKRCERSPLVRYTYAGLLESKAEKLIYSFKKSSLLRDAKTIYEQLARKGEPLALQRLIAMSDYRGLAEYQKMVVAILLVNPKRNPLSDYVIKPSGRTLAREAKEKDWENVSDASPLARKLYVGQLSAEINDFYRSNSDLRASPEGKFHALILSVFVDGDNIFSAKDYQWIFSRFTLPPYDGGVLFSGVVDNICKFITEYKELVTDKHIEDLTKVWNKLDVALKSCIEPLKINGNFTSLCRLSEQMQATSSAKFISALTNITEKNEKKPSSTHAAEFKQTSQLLSENVIQPAYNPASPQGEVEQLANEPLAEEEQILETGTHYTSEPVRISKVEYVPQAPSSEEIVVVKKPSVTGLTSKLKGDKVKQSPDAASHKKTSSSIVVIHDKNKSEEDVAAVIASNTSALLTHQLNTKMAASNTQFSANLKPGSKSHKNITGSEQKAANAERLNLEIPITTSNGLQSTTTTTRETKKTVVYT